MRAQFSLFQSHLDFAHALWQKIVKPGSVVVDATAGNGHDALILAELALTPEQGALYLFDIQKEALENSAERLREYTLSSKVTFFHRCHSEIDIALSGVQANLIVYNLGYLPGKNKEITTTRSTTLTSIQKALGCLADKGVISITCYPGHDEGKHEEEELIEFCKQLDPKTWSISSHRWLNRRAHPHLILLQRA
jgi:16S rRNA G1207 methylase RsmC